MAKAAFGNPATMDSTAPSAADEREERVCKGDFAGLYEAILMSKWHETDLPTAFSQLLRAIDIRSRQAPAAFSDELFGVMISVAGYLVLRIQHALVSQIADDDSRIRDRAPTLRIEAMLPALLQVQAHACEIAQTRASTARQWELTRQRRLENDRMEWQQRKRQKKAARLANGKPDLTEPASMWPAGKKTNGHVNRLDAILKGSQDDNPTSNE